MFYIVYKITNKINNSFYIGVHKTKNVNDGYMGSGKLIKRAINKHGLINFSKEILYIFDNEQEMLEKEKELVVICEQSYNLCEGGRGGWGYINRNKLNNDNKDKKTISQKLSRASSGKKSKHLSSLNKKKHVLGLLQKKYFGNRGKIDKIATLKAQSQEAKTKKQQKYKQNKHQQGTKNSQYGTCWITNGIENKKIKKEELDNWFELGYYKGRCKIL
jgi:hypothetical protein